MKNIDDKTVIDTVADCLRQNAAHPVTGQKNPSALVREIVKAFEELSRELTRPSPSRNKRRDRGEVRR